MKKAILPILLICIFLTACTSKGEFTKSSDDRITSPDGILENCYKAGTVYGFFRDEENIAVPLIVTSFNDKAYSITIESTEKVLPEKWYAALVEASK